MSYSKSCGGLSKSCCYIPCLQNLKTPPLCWTFIIHVYLQWSKYRDDYLVYRILLWNMLFGSTYTYPTISPFSTYQITYQDQSNHHNFFRALVCVALPISLILSNNLSKKSYLESSITYLVQIFCFSHPHSCLVSNVCHLSTIHFSKHIIYSFKTYLFFPLDDICNIPLCPNCYIFLQSKFYFQWPTWLPPVSSWDLVGNDFSMLSTDQNVDFFCWIWWCSFCL